MSVTPPPIEEQLGIQQLFARYAWAYDCRDFDAIGETFEDDGVIVMSGTERAEGREGIARWFRDYVEKTHPGKTMQHHIQHLVLDGNAEFCRAWSYWMVPVQIPGQGCLVGAVGWYEDELVRVRGQWLFRQRLIHDGMPDALPWNS